MNSLPVDFFFYLSGKCLEVEGGVRRAAQTAPPRYGATLQDTRPEMERLYVWDAHNTFMKSYSDLITMPPFILPRVLYPTIAPS